MIESGPGPKRYDNDLQMFIEAPREPNLGRLRFLRWLAERGRLEHEIAGAVGGDYTDIGQSSQPLGANRFSITPQSSIKSGSAH